MRAYQPTTPGQRGMTSQDFADITAKRPLKSLTRGKKAAAGRNNQGRITVRHRGGGARRHYRLVNFRLPLGTAATVEQIEYDPNRGARIARIKDQAGTYHYVLAAKGLKPGSQIVSDEEVNIETGNRTLLQNIPTGTVIHAIELQPGKGAQLARGAGAGAQLLAKENGYAQIKLPSGEVRMVKLQCAASIGSLGNEQHQNIKYGKAGRMRRRGIRPTVRGVVMNAADHPHGGGEGKSKGDNDPRTPWGQKTLGFKTRRRKTGGSFIVRRRNQGKRR